MTDQARRLTDLVSNFRTEGDVGQAPERTADTTTSTQSETSMELRSAA
jgi:hypothetical protein